MSSRRGSAATSGGMAVRRLNEACSLTSELSAPKPACGGGGRTHEACSARQSLQCAPQVAHGRGHEGARVRVAQSHLSHTLMLLMSASGHMSSASSSWLYR
jgi:hypothetical protein